MRNNKILSEKDRLDLRSMIGEKAGKLLETFYESDILCWLDSGSLLGVVRDKRLNDWEKDVDLGIFFDDFYKAIKISREFEKKENVKIKLKILRGVPYKLSYKYKDKSGKNKQLPIDVHIFFKLNKMAWSPQSSSLLKKGANLPDAMFNNFIEKNNKSFIFLRFAYAYPLFAFCILLKKTRLSMLINFILIVNQGLNMIFDRAYHNANSLIFRVFFKVCEWKVPLNLFESANSLPLMPPHLIIPQPVDVYLAARYGDDWRIPKSKWFYVVDDGCIYHAEQGSYRKLKKLYQQSKLK